MKSAKTFSLATLLTAGIVLYGAICFSGYANAASNKEADRAAAEKAAAEKQLQTTFSNYKITGFYESPIPGIYEIHAGSQVHYYAKEQNILIFGALYSSAGENLTEASKQKAVMSRIGSLPLKSAIPVSKGKIKLTEITNPDCGYCKKYEQWIIKMSETYSIERKIVFMENENFPQATSKIKSVVCAKDQAKAYHQMMANGVLENNSDCSKASGILQQHKEIIEGLGVQGTPSFLLPDGSVIVGFKPMELENYFLKTIKLQN